MYDKSAVTSHLCEWNCCCKSAEPTALKNIDFKRPKKDDLQQELLHEITEANYTMKRFSLSIPFEKFQQLKQIVPNVVFFKIVTLDKQEYAKSFINLDTDAADDSELNWWSSYKTSIFHEVCHQRSETKQTRKNSLLNKLMNFTSAVDAPALIIESKMKVELINCTNKILKNITVVL